MTDRELLEMAAKAAEIKSTGWIKKSHEWFQCDGVGFNDEYDCQQLWNPLTDDGDALKLAVKLNLRLVHHPVLNQVLVRPYHSNEWEDEAREDCENHPDPYAATRRAIVRAAAEIGKAMP